MRYFCVNLTAKDISSLKNIIKQYKEIEEPIGEYKKPYTAKDSEPIDLLSYLHHSVRMYRVPILFYVDCFDILRNNKTWVKCRGRNDIAIDRNGNMMRVGQI